MKIQVKNFEEMILAYLCIAGEIDEKFLFDRFGTGVLENYDYKYNYAMRSIKEMRDNRLINKKEYDRLGLKDKFLRLSSVAGDDAARALSPELYSHFFLMAGDENNRYKGSTNRLRRKRDTMKLALAHLLDGIMVDYFIVEPIKHYEEKEETVFSYRKTIYDTEGKLYSPQEILSKIEESDVCYFTSNVLKDTHKAASLMKGNTQYCGLLLAPPKCFICYYVPFADYTWGRAEGQLGSIINGYLVAMFGKRAKPPAGIFYVQDKELYDAIINPSEQKKSRNVKGRRIDPQEFFGAGYVLPMSENYQDIREFLIMEDGEEILNRLVLGASYVTGGEYDGIVKGCKIYNLLLNDTCKIKRIKEKVEREDSLIVVHDWQVASLLKYYGDDTRYIAIDSGKFHDYLLDAY